MAKDLKISVLIDCYGEILTDKQKDVLDLYYNEDLSLSEIAEIEGISRQGVRDSIKRGEAQLLEMEEKLHIWEKTSEKNEAVKKIYELAAEIDNYNSRFCYSHEIESRCKEILSLAEGFFKED